MGGGVDITIRSIEILTISMDISEQTKWHISKDMEKLKKKRKRKTQKHHQPTKSNQHFQNTPPSNSKMYIFLKCSKNIRQDRLYPRP